MHILITGAGGHLGRKLFEYFSAKPEFTVSGLDIRATDHPNIHQADLSGEPIWASFLEGVDIIIHLAGDREPTATWESAIKNNMDATLALYHHAAEKGVSRVILASSNWLHGDKRFTDDTLDSKTPPGPINAYGMSKLFCERTGEYFSKYRNLSVICLRIGWAQWTHGNQPGSHMAMGRWGQEMWLSDEDLFSGFIAAVSAKNVSFAALNLMSNNQGMRWNIAETKEIIGYVPKDSSTPQISTSIKIKSALKKLTCHSLPRWFEKKFPEW